MSSILKLSTYAFSAAFLCVLWVTAGVLASGSPWWIWYEPGGVQFLWLYPALWAYAATVVAQVVLRLMGSGASYWHVALPVLAAGALAPALSDLRRAELSLGLTLVVSMMAVAVLLRAVVVRAKGATAEPMVP